MRGFVGSAAANDDWTEVAAASKDELLLALLEERYMGNERAVEDFRDWCQAHGIAHRFVTWPSDYEP